MDGLSVDWVSDVIFWTDTKRKEISASLLDGSLVKVIVKDELGEPRAIDVSPKHGLIFWTDWGERARIERANQDGSDRRLLVTQNIAWPNGLTVDGERLFWIDAKADINAISSCDFGGGKRKILTMTKSGFSLTMWRKSVFWSNFENSQISTIDLETNHKRAFSARIDVPNVWAVRAVSADRQPQGEQLFKIKNF